MVTAEVNSWKHKLKILQEEAQMRRQAAETAELQAMEEATMTAQAIIHQVSCNTTDIIYFFTIKHLCC
jgi:hypothetical protein